MLAQCSRWIGALGLGDAGIGQGTAVDKNAGVRSPAFSTQAQRRSVRRFRIWRRTARHAEHRYDGAIACRAKTGRAPAGARSPPLRGGLARLPSGTGRIGARPRAGNSRATVNGLPVRFAAAGPGPGPPSRRRALRPDAVRDARRRAAGWRWAQALRRGTVDLALDDPLDGGQQLDLFVVHQRNRAAGAACAAGTADAVPNIVFRHIGQFRVLETTNWSMSRPRAAMSVATSTGSLPVLNCSSARVRAAWLLLP